jgi:hypothetical protein
LQSEEVLAFVILEPARLFSGSLPRVRKYLSLDRGLEAIFLDVVREVKAKDGIRPGA